MKNIFATLILVIFIILPIGFWLFGLLNENDTLYRGINVLVIISVTLFVLGIIFISKFFEKDKNNKNL